MIIMSVDLGDARTGIALSDESETFAFPKEQIKQYNKQKRIEEIVSAAKKYNAEEIVVGLPKNMDGTLGFRAQECTETAEKIAELSGLKVSMWDERCTTVLAHNELNVTDTRGKKRKQAVDSLAAVIILEDYMKFRHLGK